jgi:hypothetical protein
MQDTSVKQPISSIWLIVIIGLLTANFLFDFWRRYYFESEKRKTAELIAELRAQTATELASIQGLFDAADEGIINLSTRASELSEYIRSIADGSVPKTGGDVPEEPTDTKKPGVFELPAEFLEEAITRGDRDPFLKKFKPRVRMPHDWESDELLSELETELGMQLSSEDWEACEQILKYHQNMAHLAWASMKARQHLMMAERIIDGDYITRDANGSMRPPEGSKHFHSVTANNRMFVSTKESQPELYRRYKVFHYIPQVMLEEIRDSFFRRNGR